MTNRLPAPTIVLLLSMLGGQAVAGDWRAMPEASVLGFTASAQGERFSGQFRTFDVRLRFDPAQPALAQLDVRIDLASVDSANSERDEMLAEPEFFAVDKAPEARFSATGFRDIGDGRYEADGELHLRGHVRPVRLALRWSGGDTPVLEGEAMLDRLDFDVGGGEWADASTIDHEVEVHTRLQLGPVGPAPDDRRETDELSRQPR